MKMTGIQGTAFLSNSRQDGRIEGAAPVREKEAFAVVKTIKLSKWIMKTLLPIYAPTVPLLKSIKSFAASADGVGAPACPAAGQVRWSPGHAGRQKLPKIRRILLRQGTSKQELFVRFAEEKVFSACGRF